MSKEWRRDGARYTACFGHEQMGMRKTESHEICVHFMCPSDGKWRPRHRPFQFDPHLMRHSERPSAPEYATMKETAVSMNGTGVVHFVLTDP